MAPNTVVKPTFSCKSDYEPSKSEDRNTIRTDFILQNIFSHLIASGSNYPAHEAANERERNVLCELKDVLDTFRINFMRSVNELCSQIELKEERIVSALLGVSNELFCEGITWSRIIALFAFVGEFTLMCLSKEFDTNVVDVIYETFCRFVKENLTGWIEDHGGWEGVKIFSRIPIQEQCTQDVPSTSEVSTSTVPSTNVSNKGWAKSLLHGTVRMIGTLAQIANSTQGFP